MRLPSFRSQLTTARAPNTLSLPPPSSPASSTMGIPMMRRHPLPRATFCSQRCNLPPPQRPRVSHEFNFIGADFASLPTRGGGEESFSVSAGSRASIKTGNVRFRRPLRSGRRRFPRGLLGYRLAEMFFFRHHFALCQQHIHAVAHQRMIRLQLFLANGRVRSGAGVAPMIRVLSLSVRYGIAG